jgi:hypothetical protein
MRSPAPTTANVFPLWLISNPIIFSLQNGSDQWLAHGSTTPQDDDESIASRGSGRSSTWSRHPTSRRLHSTGAPGPLANADRPPPQAAGSRDEHRVASSGGADPGQMASGASTPLQPSRSFRARAPQGQRRATPPRHHLYLEATRVEVARLGRYAALLPTRRFTTSMERES